MRLSRTVSSLALAGAVALLPHAPAVHGSTVDAVASAVPAGCVAAAAPNTLDCVVPAPEGMGQIDTSVRVVVPASYGEAPVPVVYLFHGVGDSYRSWVDNTDVETFASQLDVLVVMPDGGRTPNAGWYSDWVDGSRKWETFHTGVLIPWVEASFTTLAGREHRATAGLSMGGFGALSYAGRHPDLYAAAASFSGLVDTQTLGPVTGIGMGLGRSNLGTPDSNVWGDPALARDEWSAHNPTAIARAGGYRHLDGNLWLTFGTGTPGGPAGENANKGLNYGIEHYIWQTNQQLKVALTQTATSHRDLSYVGGYHDWPNWQHSLHLVLPDLVAAIS